MSRDELRGELFTIKMLLCGILYFITDGRNAVGFAVLTLVMFAASVVCFYREARRRRKP